MTNNQPQISYEDNHLIAINKPSGILVQPDKSGDIALEDAVKDFLKQKYQKPGEAFIGICHRIDRPVSGIVLMAKTSKALARMNELFKTREVTKTYWAVVENMPDEENKTLVHWLKKDERQNISRAYQHEVHGSQRCELHYRLLQKSDRYFLLEVNPVTGRHHQIRVQLAAIGCPIKGDVKYGARRTNKDGRIHLHARSISFMHPVKKEPVTITAPLPDEVLWQAFEKGF